MTDEFNPKAIVPYEDDQQPVDASEKAGLPARLQLMIMEADGGVLIKDVADVLVLGRRGSGKAVDVDLTDFHAHQLGISRQHAQIECSGERVMLRDLGSTNGTQLNGDKLTPGHVYEIAHGDRLKLGRMHIRVYFDYEA